MSRTTGFLWFRFRFGLVFISYSPLIKRYYNPCTAFGTSAYWVWDAVLIVQLGNHFDKPPLGIYLPYFRTLYGHIHFKCGVATRTLVFDLVSHF